MQGVVRVEGLSPKPSTKAYLEGHGDLVGA